MLRFEITTDQNRPTEKITVFLGGFGEAFTRRTCLFFGNLNLYPFKVSASMVRINGAVVGPTLKYA